MARRLVHRPVAYLHIEGTRHYLGRWDTAADVKLARDRAALWAGMTWRQLSNPKLARKLGPASPDELRRLAKDAQRAKTASSRYEFVSFSASSQRWSVRISLEGHLVYAAHYQDEESAAVDVDRILLFFGRPKVNFPDRRTRRASPETIRNERRLARRVNGSSTFIGVHVRPNQKRGPWFFAIWRGDNSVTIGGFESERDAAVTRDRAALFYQSNPDLNFPIDARALGPASLDQIRSEVYERRKRS